MSLEKNLENITSAVMTISDRSFLKKMEDLSGPTLVEELKKRGALIQETVIVPDDIQKIQSALLNLVKSKVSLIVTTGGTGLGPRDLTPEALKGLWTRTIPGFGELLRRQGAKYTEKSYLSRCEAGLIEKTLVVTLAGSPNACREGIAILENLIAHAIHVIHGKDHEASLK